MAFFGAAGELVINPKTANALGLTVLAARPCRRIDPLRSYVHS
jgi:hypothetical protein